jgi:uncharacterized membrane protein (DUF2068 family)
MLHRHHDGNVFALRMVAVFEAVKGLLAVLLAVSLLRLIDKNLDVYVDRLTRILHLDPQGRFSDLLYAVVDRITERNLWLIAAAAIVYAVLRFAEAVGLWHNRVWAQWFALISGGIYLPFEMYTLVRHPHPYKWIILLLNVTIILYMLLLRMRHYKVSPAPRN